MPVHVEPDELRQLSRVFWQHHLHAADSLQVLRASLYRLEMAWEGRTAAAFVYEMQSLIRHLNVTADDLVGLGLILSREADRWDEGDQYWTAIFRDLQSRESL